MIYRPDLKHRKIDLDLDRHTSGSRIAPPDYTYKPYEAACSCLTKIIEAWRSIDKQELFQRTNIWMWFYHDKMENDRGISYLGDGLPKSDLTLFNDFVADIQAWGWGLPHTDITIGRVRAIQIRIMELKDVEKQSVQIFY